MRYERADVRFNSGVGALLCNRCNVIIEYGFDHKDEFHFCEKCEPHAQKWILEELAEQDQEFDNES